MDDKNRYTRTHAEGVLKDANWKYILYSVHCII